MSIQAAYVDGKRNKHGTPLRKLLIFGKTGLPDVREWKRRWMK
jgi:hypothetical protein